MSSVVSSMGSRWSEEGREPGPRLQHCEGPESWLMSWCVKKRKISFQNWEAEDQCNVDDTEPKWKYEEQELWYRLQWTHFCKTGLEPALVDLIKHVSAPLGELCCPKWQGEAGIVFTPLVPYLVPYFGPLFWQQGEAGIVFSPYFGHNGQQQDEACTIWFNIFWSLVHVDTIWRQKSCWCKNHSKMLHHNT